MSRHLVMGNDFGEVELDADILDAIERIREAAWILQMLPHEFMAAFDYGIPECPCCTDQKKALN